MIDTRATARVQTLLEEIVESGDETGLQAAAYHDGRLVIDAAAGIADPATGRRVDGDTLFTVFSTSKGITTTAIHLLAERGLLDYDTVDALWQSHRSGANWGMQLWNLLNVSAWHDYWIAGREGAWAAPSVR